MPEKTGPRGRLKTRAMSFLSVELEFWNNGVVGKQFFQPITPTLHHSNTPARI